MKKLLYLWASFMGGRAGFSLLRRSLGSVVAVLALFCLIAGVTQLPFSSLATAESERPDAGLPPGHSVNEQKPLSRSSLLQAVVDTVALGLGGSLTSVEREEERRAVLSRALDALTFDLGENIHFTAWEGERLVHWPHVPDATDLDFAAALDTRGVAFVRAMRECGDQGGFVQVSLPRRKYDSVVTGRANHERVTQPQAASQYRDPLLYYSPDSSLGHTVSEETMLVYTRRIPASNWRISAFMIKDTDVVHPEETPAFSAVWSASRHEPVHGNTAGDLRAGLWVSGFSLAGLAGLLFVPGTPSAGRRD